MTTSNSGLRGVRVADRVRAELVLVLSRSVSDPRLEGLRVLRVEVSGDLQIAWVYLGLGHLDTPSRRVQAIRGLHSAKGRLRKLISPKLGMRRVPDLRFAFDEAIGEEERIFALFDEVRAGA